MIIMKIIMVTTTITVILLIAMGRCCVLSQVDCCTRKITAVS